jgi:hypothetical protein
MLQRKSIKELANSSAKTLLQLFHKMNSSAINFASELNIKAVEEPQF